MYVHTGKDKHTYIHNMYMRIMYVCTYYVDRPTCMHACMLVCMQCYMPHLLHNKAVIAPTRCYISAKTSNETQNQSITSRIGGPTDTHSNSRGTYTYVYICTYALDGQPGDPCTRLHSSYAQTNATQYTRTPAVS